MSESIKPTAEDVKTAKEFFELCRDGFMGIAELRTLATFFARHRLSERTRIAGVVRDEAEKYGRFGDFASESGVLRELARRLEGESEVRNDRP